MAVAVPGRHHCLKAWLSIDKFLISMAKHDSARFSMKKHDLCIGIQRLGSASRYSIQQLDSALRFSWEISDLLLEGDQSN